MKLIGSGNAYVLWRSLSGCAPSNWLSANWYASGKVGSTDSGYLLTPKYLRCPADSKRTAQTNFMNLRDANISYFFSLDAMETYPQMILDGDDNLVVDGERAKPGTLIFTTNSGVVWTKERHYLAGNIGMADGSVQQGTSASLSSVIVAGVPVSPLTLLYPVGCFRKARFLSSNGI
jgi:prepilin-type processing-associated H-X9-DG protein